LIIFVTVIAFGLYLYTLNNWSASGTSYAFVIIPLITIIIASSIANEEITSNFLLGTVMVLSGVIVGALLPQKADS
jgi:drug/metabolite transporter (DMT)-like permease